MNQQASLNFAPSLTTQFPHLRDVVCAAVYSSRTGLKGIAADLDVSPSELSRMLNREQGDPRKLDCDDLVGIIAATGDVRPVQWLVEKFTRDPERVRADAAAQLAALLPMLGALVEQASAADTLPRRAKR